MPPRGPLPKSDEARQRSNAPAVETTVLGSAPAKTSAPKLTRSARRALHVEARAWWDDLLVAPQASQFIRTDWRRLRGVVLPLVDRYHRELDADEPDDARLVALAREIRQHEREFGLTPDSRQRMRWVMKDESGGAAKDAKPEGKGKPRRVRSDPRLKLVGGKAD